MADSDLRSLPLHELVSAPLTAAIEAQQQASLGVVSFIQDVGFGDDDQDQPVRMVDFRYTRPARDIDGRRVTRTAVLRIPLLSMVSIPVLEIDTLEVNVLINVRDVGTAATSPRLKVPDDLRARYPFLAGRSTLRVSPTSRTMVKGGTQTTRSYDLEISMTASGQEPTDGIERLMTSIAGLVTEEDEE